MTGSSDAHGASAVRETGGAGGSDGSVPLDDLPTTVRFESEPARAFSDSAIQEYLKCLDSRGADGVPTHLPRASGLLFGRQDGTQIVISAIEFVPNVRDSDESVMAEFEHTIAPQFGNVYRNPGRGFWCDEERVLRAVKKNAERGLDLMGSIHSHPNWHEIGPPHERQQKLSDNPTRMDEYLFRQSSWPINVIWYVHTSGEVLAHRVSGWRPGPEQCERLDVQIPIAVCDQFGVVLPKGP